MNKIPVSPSPKVTLMRSAMKRSRFSRTVSRSWRWRLASSAVTPEASEALCELIFLHQQFGRFRTHHPRPTALELQQQPVVSAPGFCQLRHNFLFVLANRQSVLIDTDRARGQWQARSYALDLVPHLLYRGHVARQTLPPHQEQFLPSYGSCQGPHIRRGVNDRYVDELPFPVAQWAGIHLSAS
jgi:hypothetical protein